MSDAGKVSPADVRPSAARNAWSDASPLRRVMKHCSIASAVERFGSIPRLQGGAVHGLGLRAAAGSRPSAVGPSICRHQTTSSLCRR
ncbi:protein of unknown function [Paraburkholderia kururiensis]